MKTKLLLITIIILLPPGIQAQKLAPDTCIQFLNSLKYNNLDSGKALIYKSPITNFIQRIKDCDAGFVYDKHYEDRYFEITVPNYFIWDDFKMVKVTYGFGKEDFYFSLNDVQQLERTIEIHYDLVNKWTAGFNKAVESGQNSPKIVKVGGQEMILFRNYQDKFCGRVTLDRNTFINYCTKEEKYELQLQEAILSFKWK